jgi:hypothetical protein
VGQAKVAFAFLVVLARLPELQEPDPAVLPAQIQLQAAFVYAHEAFEAIGVEDAGSRVLRGPGTAATNGYNSYNS